MKNKLEMVATSSTNKKVSSQVAVIQTGGQQLRVTVGQHIWINKVDLPVKSEIIFDQVLMIDDHFGQPLLPKARVRGEVIKTNKAKKIVVFKYKPKKGYHKKQGHRQWQTRVLINAIALDGVFKASQSVPTPQADGD